MFNLQNIRKLALILALVLLSGNVGYRLGQKQVQFTLTKEKKIVINASPPPNRNVDFSLFWDVWSRLEQRYLQQDKIDPQKMVYGAISGMVGSLGDPYTVFLPPKDNSEFKEDLNGTFEGIGAQLGAKNDKIVVIAPLKDHPAEKAGIQAGDWIIKVNGEDTFNWTVPQAVGKIRGPKGTSVTLSIVHEGESNPVDISVTRDKILLKSVEFEIKTAGDEACKTSACPEVGLIKLNRFGDTTNDEWSQVVSQARASLNQSPPIKGLVLDLRNNPGGYFQSSINIASEFIKTGVVVVQENSDGTRETFSVTKVGELLDVPLVVLINKGSASAAEIVSGALRDHKRATLIGEKTFGKGSIQTPEDLADGSGIHITTARWILPNGEWINGTGIKPDIEVKNSDSSASADLQLEQAIQELTN
ncbi:MAG: Carboxyl-terminal protease [Candidatus Gottesmanbacteria bacterium GW2011_GWB1_43_11]|uniref:Carboxyl-terminal protease n=1 Tax=Candidatus Gottesmanbacteria bacterium GW2011_GWB1_43_11 TaxID=1618446 RepID=A0A0G1CMB4_9BACT|nr:MAG: Carboxyl-terminal protease [Candidatus Gottesmanbacteria bacterium GW2011_GWA2_42_16]KKS54938.1 MAG: Carboxyl-terminal protease [Candidatus Gottesmanbacteria bacterium GW2011_GWA1_42_26]KKS82128.1 MAG: Carboxyl-terminal protease [Candidatus Gottesmanbacteria bacterium GW2011_GWC1_43_10]KKS86644.1 MAG: Carboxyl-terminal protease [Candidatus Gottesmanbacteria bacterium GW2011_GWB1_43_11]OGG10587.1 MAG: hypothetical protein A2699_02905 [Candidatus Gottesmanbacteria bacterium RIFCSPHIGHO2_0